MRPPAETSSGTGVLIRVADDHFVLTAHHVLAGYAAKIAERGHAHFQIGQLDVCPLCRVVYEDESNDLSLIAILPSEVATIGSTPYVLDRDRPPPLPKVGQMIQFCGYARINRIDGEAGQIDSTVLPLIATIDNCDGSHFSVAVEREKYRWDGECLLRPEQKFLGGMSGGPALLLDGSNLPLVGIVSEGHDDFGIVTFRPVSLIPWKRLPSQLSLA